LFLEGQLQDEHKNLFCNQEAIRKIGEIILNLVEELFPVKSDDLSEEVKTLTEALLPIVTQVYLVKPDMNFECADYEQKTFDSAKHQSFLEDIPTDSQIMVLLPSLTLKDITHQRAVVLNVSP